MSEIGFNDADVIPPIQPGFSPLKKGLRGKQLSLNK